MAMIEPDGRLDALNAGQRETATLAEVLAVDFSVLLRSSLPEHASLLETDIEGIVGLGISARMAGMGKLLLDRLGPAAIEILGRHSSDTVRGWACFAIGAQAIPLAEQLAAIRAFADDHHFGVREWAWLAVRPAIAGHLEDAFGILSGWTCDPSERIRRFVSEATRPRGVWCKHIAALKTDPEPGRVLLDPLRADTSPYVQDSVGNWLNDAAKSRPDWVCSLIAEWLDESPRPETRRIARRALRSVDKTRAPHKDIP
jgi:3-methyladenine DNA glycosylase AlkC